MKLLILLILLLLSSPVIAANQYREMIAFGSTVTTITNAVQAACMGVKAVNTQQARIDATWNCSPESVLNSNGWYDKLNAGSNTPESSFIRYRKRESGTPLEPVVNITWSALSTCPVDQEFNESTGQCESPQPQCDSGIEKLAHGPIGGNACYDGCSYSHSGGIIRDEFLHGKWTSTGSTCETGTMTEKSDLCINIGSEQLCLNPQQTNCGTFNGSNVCVDAIPAGNCALLPGGSYICESTADTPPVPNSGTPGVPATPDASITHNNTTTNYYSQSTVNSSSGLADGTGTQYGSGTGDSGQKGSGSNNDDSGDSVTPGGAGDFGGASGRLTEIRTISESGDLVMDALTGPNSIYGQIQGLNLTTSEGQCPTVSIPFLENGSVTMDMHCTIYEEVKPILQVVFHLIWIVLGILIVLTA